MAKFVQSTFDVYGVAEFKNQVTFDTSVFLTAQTYISNPTESSSDTPYALLVDSIGSNVVVKYRQLGDMAWETAANYASSTDIADVSSRVDTNETAITRIDSDIAD